MRPIQARLSFNSFPKFAFAFLALAIFAGGFLTYAKRSGNFNSKANVISKSQPDRSANSKRQVLSEYGKLPLAFEPNRGQSDPAVKYMARGSGYTLFLTSNEAVLSMSQPVPRGKQASSAVVRMQVAGARTPLQITPLEQESGISNYFLGKDPAKWQTNVPQYARVNYQEVYPGVDLAFHGAQRQMEFDFVVRPHADARQIALKFSGTRHLRADENGDLILSTTAGDVRLHKPVAYQEMAGTREPVEARFALSGTDEVKFAVGRYDKSRELVIDPTVSYATYIGGSGEDRGTSIAVDHNCVSNCNVYVTGETASADFPATLGAFAGGSGHDAFVTKINPSGVLVYSTFIGGTQDDVGNGIDVDSSGNAYIAGGTASSSDFPTTTGAFQTGFGGGSLDAFFSKLNSAGALQYSTFLGGNDTDTANAIAVDSAGSAYITGQTLSVNSYPTKNPIQASNAGVFDAFVSKVNPQGLGASDLVYSTYLGGTNVENATSIAVDASQNAYITGETFSGDFPSTTGAYDTTCGSDSACDGTSDAFLTKINSAGSVLSYSTFFGGSKAERGDGVTVDSVGSVYVTGLTKSDTNFPLKSAAQSTYGGGLQDAFVAKFNPAATGSSDLTYSTYLGGNDFDEGYGIALDNSNNAYITGQTLSTNFDHTNGIYTTISGTNDAFVTEIASSGSTILFSTYFGGSGNENTLSPGIVLDAAGNIYITGDTDSSSGFPLVAALQNSFGGVADAFIAKLAPSVGVPDFSVAATALAPASVAAGSSATSTVTVGALSGFTGTVALACSNVSPAVTNGPTCSFNPSSVTGAGTSTLTVSTTGTPSNTYTFTVTGTSGALGHSTTVTLAVTGSATPDFTVSATALSPASISAGASATSTVTVTPTNGFTGAVTFTCGIVPAVTSPPACSFNPASVNGSGTSALTVSTTSSTPRAALQRSLPLYAAWLPICGVALLGIRNRKALTVLLGVIAICGLLFLGACGGGSGNGGGGGGGGGTSTTYTITVTGTSGGLSHSQALTLTVN